MNTQRTHHSEQDEQYFRKQLETARALAMKVISDDSIQDIADLLSRIDQVKAAAAADREFEERLSGTMSDDLERAEEMAIRDAAIGQLETFIRQSMTTDQVLGVQAFAAALITGAITPAFFEVMADSFQAQGASK